MLSETVSLPRNFSQPTPKSLDHVDTHVKVVCRIRPLNSTEQTNGDLESVYATDENTVTVKNKDVEQRFLFDRACDGRTSQLEFYDIVTHETLNKFFQGFNGTILAYGQTGAGKSHTMFGPLSDRGIVPRISRSIFSHIALGLSDIEYTVSISIMEIYNELIRDLLNPYPVAKECTVHEDKINGVFVKGLSHAFVSSATEMNEVVNQGSKRRTVSSTHMNAESSRSHSLIQIVLNQKNVDNGSLTKSTLFLVDLAGSEKADRTGAYGSSLEEAKKINLSLSVLSLVINSLADSKLTHIPYRDSKLTRILQESLGGNSRTTLIVNCSPALSCVLESMSSLRFATRAKKVKNSLHINTELSVDQLKARVAALEKLNRDLEGERRHSQYDHSVLSPGPNRKATGPERVLVLKDELERKNVRIAELEQEILSLKISQLRELHSEDLKLFRLESALRTLSDKLSDVELINNSLRKHLLISEKIIDSREAKIDKLRLLLYDQQEQVEKESTQFESKLQLLRNKLEAKRLADTSGYADESFEANTSDTLDHFFANLSIAEQILDGSATSSPVRNRLGDDQGYSGTSSPLRGKVADPSHSPKIGLNLKIVKPVRGGQSDHSGAEATTT